MLMTRTEMEDPNWKNVGNWHWVDKDCLPYARDYFTSNLTAIEKEEGDKMSCKITELKEFAGDCTLSVRKGKLFTIYDLNLTCAFVGKDEKCNVNGTIHVPEIISDFSDSDFVFELTLDNPSSAFKNFLKTKVYPEVIRICQALPENVIQNQRKDVYIENAVPSVALPKADLEERKKLAATLAASAPAAAASALGTVRSAPAAVAPLPAVVAASRPTTCTVRLTFHFVAPASEVLACFVEDPRVKQWTQGQGSVDGTSLRLFDQIEATVTRPADLTLTMVWKMKAWTHPSNVSLQFEQHDQTQLTLVHTNVPQSEQPMVERHWREVMQRIKMVFGYGSFF